MQVDTHLEHFMPLIQLWAPICLLILYNPLIEKMPLNQLIENLDEDYAAYRRSAIGTLQSVEELFCSKKWRNLMPRIKNMAAVSFGYCLFLLVFIAILRSEVAFPSIYNYPFLVICDFTILFYLIICCFCNVRLFRSYWTPALAVLCITIAFFLLSLYGNPDNPISNSQYWPLTTALTLITCFMGFPLVLFRIVKDKKHVNDMKNKLFLLQNNYNGLAQLSTDVSNVKQLDDLDEKQKNTICAIFYKDFHSEVQLLLANDIQKGAIVASSIRNEVHRINVFSKLSLDSKILIRPLLINALDKSVVNKKIESVMLEEYKIFASSDV